MCDFQYDYSNPKYDEKAKLCYMDTDIKVIYIYKVIAEDFLLQAVNQIDH